MYSGLTFDQLADAMDELTQIAKNTMAWLISTSLISQRSPVRYRQYVNIFLNKKISFYLHLQEISTIYSAHTFP